MLRRAFALAVAAAVGGALAAGPLPAAFAAVPVSSAAIVQNDSAVVLVQGKKKRKSARQKEVDSSMKSGTVPKRYRSQIPKQYHQHIPFAK